MADLSLKEALTEYEAECREVLGGLPCLTLMCDEMKQYHHKALLGACVVWLKGKRRRQGVHDWHPKEPLRFYLNEVREHMQPTTGEE